ncbi:MAG: TRAP transporter substrate-binding protein [Alphaproteobacteria bacterium]|nr:TRAP transporter substrate-binding protein [Alphaproteobacteria bacterium]
MNSCWKNSLGLVAAALVCAAPGGVSAETTTLKVLGHPGATGLIQKNKEAPFFAAFAERTGLDIKTNFQPLDQTGIKAAEQLRLLKSGLFDIISLRLQQVSRDEPMILGLDLVGLNSSYDAARKSVEAFKDPLDKRLQQQFGTKLLSLWPFGPQILFCKPEIKGLADVKGKKVRVYDQSLANFISSVGGIPVPLGFPDVHQSLSRGVVDCAITGPSSANSASWPEVTTHVLPLGFQSAIQGYGISMKVWQKFSDDEKAKIQAAFDKLTEEIWSYSEELFDDAMRCNVGETPCELNKPYKMTKVAISDADLKVVEKAVKELSFPAWAKICDANNPGCSETWKKTVGKRLGM